MLSLPQNPRSERYNVQYHDSTIRILIMSKGMTLDAVIRWNTVPSNKITNKASQENRHTTTPLPDEESFVMVTS